MADDTVWPHVRVERKLRLWLVANGRWTELRTLLHHFGSTDRFPELSCATDVCTPWPSGCPVPPELPPMSGAQREPDCAFGLHRTRRLAR